MKKALFALAALAVMAVSPALTQAGIVYSLADLIANNGVVVSGDKEFSNFEYTSSGDMPDAADVNIEDITDIFGNFGIRISGGFSTGSATLSYQVKATAHGFFISDAHIFSNPSVVGGDGLFSVDESFAEEPGSDISVFESVVGGVKTEVNADGVIFPSIHKTLNVEKEFTGISDGGTPILSFVDQTFSQVFVPEPASLAVLGGIGVLGLIRARRRNRS